MPKIKLRNRWLVYFGSREQLLGYVEALSEGQAVELAIKKYHFSTPMQQRQLVARRYKYKPRGPSRSAVIEPLATEMRPRQAIIVQARPPGVRDLAAAHIDDPLAHGRLLLLRSRSRQGSARREDPG